VSHGTGATTLSFWPFSELFFFPFSASVALAPACHRTAEFADGARHAEHTKTPSSALPDEYDRAAVGM
jgi:hypothetical protein